MVCEGSPKDCLIDTGNHENISLQKTAFKSIPISPTTSSEHNIQLPKTPFYRRLLPRAAIGADPVPADEPASQTSPTTFFYHHFSRASAYSASY